MSRRILVAGIGNIFLGDDAFGVEVVRRLAARPSVDGLDVVDFGIRGIDLTYALLEPYEMVILVDAAPRGDAPGTLYVLELDVQSVADAKIQATMPLHNLDPVKAIQAARAWGTITARLYLVGCEPQPFENEDAGFMQGLSAPVLRAVDEAVGLVEKLIQKAPGEPCTSFP